MSIANWSFLGVGFLLGYASVVLGLRLDRWLSKRREIKRQRESLNSRRQYGRSLPLSQHGAWSESNNLRKRGIR